MTHIEKITEQLAAISPNITSEDRKALHETHGYKKGTISIYINGKGVSVDTGLVMLTFFRKRIADREKAIV